MAKIISGIQQIGIGVSNVHEAWTWYRKHFKMDIPIFEEAADANLMLPYTGGKPQKRHAILAMNMQGGGGFEIWQYTSRVPQPAAFVPQLGDLGINVCKIKCRSAMAAHLFISASGARVLTPVHSDPGGTPQFWVKDPYGNSFQVIESKSWFSKNNDTTGGVCGVMIGVTNIDQSLKLYRDILGYDLLAYDITGTFEDFKAVPGGSNHFRRVKLTHAKPRRGGFSQLLGATEIELIQATGRKPEQIFKDRFWGDLGYIHLCFDVVDMADLKVECAKLGFPFTVDSPPDFDMGEAAGHFAYIEDPDKTLIEFVETHRIPIMKKIGWYLNLKKRNPEKPLPRWMLRTLSFNRNKR
jgi:catechol 2,3-dioxygenase-like lactoylglutathione lyase family enzyme